MTRYLLSALLVGGLVATANANNNAKVAPSKVSSPVPVRFAGESTDEGDREPKLGTGPGGSGDDTTS